MNFETPQSPEQNEMTPEKLREVFAKIVDSEFKLKEPKEGKETARPFVRKLYANQALRKLLLDSDAKSGEIEIMGVTFEIVTGRTKPDGQMASIIHQSSQGLVERFLLNKYDITEEDMGIEIPPLVELQTGQFKTKAGPKFPRKNTIYATAILRTILGIEGKTGEIEIDGETYTVKSGRKTSEEDVSYTNYTTKSVKEKFNKMYENQ